MGQIKLPVLQKGDTASLIAPARAVTEAEMAPFLAWAAHHGILIKAGKHLYGRHHQFSGDDAQRAEDFVAAWTDPEVKAVFCARGGYGCMRFLHLIEKEVWAKGAGKILVGYSDITTLHLALNKQGIETLHAPMAINFFEPGQGTEENLLRLAEALFYGRVDMDLSENEKIHAAPFEGELVGGNLSLIYAALGTDEQPDTKGKILFLEDLDEYLYHIDRMMVSLKRAGLLSGLKALLVGGMDKMNDNTVAFGLQAEEIIRHHVEEYGYPVIFGFPAGHGIKNYSFKLSAFTTFDGSILNQP
jgi:muramoyltetrapeptide carboxypeptidase